MWYIHERHYWHNTGASLCSDTLVARQPTRFWVQLYKNHHTLCGCLWTRLHTHVPVITHTIHRVIKRLLIQNLTNNICHFVVYKSCMPSLPIMTLAWRYAYLFQGSHQTDSCMNEWQQLGLWSLHMISTWSAHAHHVTDTCTKCNCGCVYVYIICKVSHANSVTVTCTSCDCHKVNVTHQEYFGPAIVSTKHMA